MGALPFPDECRQTVAPDDSDRRRQLHFEHPFINGPLKAPKREKYSQYNTIFNLINFYIKQHNLSPALPLNISHHTGKGQKQ